MKARKKIAIFLSLLSLFIQIPVYSQQWTNRGSFGTDVEGVYMPNADIIYVLSYTYSDGHTRFYRSTDKGESFPFIKDFGNAQTGGASMSFINANTGWVEYSDESNYVFKDCIYRTNNGGTTWNLVTNTLPYLDFGFIMKFINDVSGNGVGFRYNVFGNQTNLYKTVNNGVSWNLVWTGPGNINDFTKSVFDPNNNTVYASVHLSNNNPYLVGSADGFNSTYVFLDGNNNWYNFNDVRFISSVIDNNQEILKLGSTGMLGEVTGPTSFNDIAQNPLGTNMGYFKFSDRNNGFMNGNNQILFSSNGGLSWSSEYNGEIASSYFSNLIDMVGQKGIMSNSPSILIRFLNMQLNTNHDWQPNSGVIVVDGHQYNTPDYNEYLNGGTFSLSEPQPWLPVPNGSSDTTAQFYYWGGDLNGSTDYTNNFVYLVNSNKQINADYKTNLISTDNNILQNANQTKSLIDTNGVTNLIYESMGGLFFTRTRPDGKLKLDEDVTYAFENGYKIWGNSNPFITEIKSIGAGVNSEQNVAATWEQRNNNNVVTIYYVERGHPLGLIPKWNYHYNSFTVSNVIPGQFCYPKVFVAENDGSRWDYVLTYLKPVGNSTHIAAKCSSLSSSTEFDLIPNENVSEYCVSCVINQNAKFDLFIFYRVNNDVRFRHFQLSYENGYGWGYYEYTSEYVQFYNFYKNKGDLDITLRNYDGQGNMQPAIVYKGQLNAALKNPGGNTLTSFTYYPFTWEGRNSSGGPNSWGLSRAIYKTYPQNQCNIDGNKNSNSFIINFWQGNLNNPGYTVYEILNDGPPGGSNFEAQNITDAKIVKNSVGTDGSFQMLTLIGPSNNVYQLGVQSCGVSNASNSLNTDEVSATAFADNIQYMFNLGCIIVNSQQVGFDVSGDTGIYDVSDMNNALSTNAFWLNDGDTLIVGRSAFYLNSDSTNNFSSVIYSTVLMRNSNDKPVCTLDVDTLNVNDSADVEALYGYIISGYGSDSFYVELQLDTLWNIDSSLIGGVSGGFSGFSSGGDNAHRSLKDYVFFKNKIKNPNNVIPTVFSLHQNYPNPFNPATTIKYDIPKATMVTIKVYDILGREVSTLINELKQPGFYEAKFDGTKFASGVYFYRINAGKFTNVKKMVLLK